MDKEKKRCMDQNLNNMKSRTAWSEAKKYLNSKRGSSTLLNENGKEVTDENIKAQNQDSDEDPLKNYKTD